MIIGTISKYFDDEGCVITKSGKENILDLNYKKIITLFEKYGIILFKGFDIEPHKITSFTDSYTFKYARNADRRKARFKQNNIHDVDLGNDEHSLHSEGSYSPVSPEIIWFYCNIPPKSGGETILCDGKRLWNEFDTKFKAFFLKEPLRYEIEIPTNIVRKGKENQTWISNTLGTSGYIDWNNGLICFTQLQYAVNQTRFGKSISFCNHLLAELGKDPQLKNSKMLMASGVEVPENYLQEIKNKSDALTYEHKWEKRDILMIDNKRFMHGRRSFKKNIKRDIAIIQTEKASFGYGATTRKPIS